VIVNQIVGVVDVRTVLVAVGAIAANGIAIGVVVKAARSLWRHAWHFIPDHGVSWTESVDSSPEADLNPEWLADKKERDTHMYIPDGHEGSMYKW
jgi:hypothetical protein